LQLHVRRCTDCATFVGARSRTSIARLLWLPTLPFRKIGARVFGTTGAPVATSAGAAERSPRRCSRSPRSGRPRVGVTARQVDAPASRATALLPLGALDLRPPAAPAKTAPASPPPAPAEHVDADPGQTATVPTVETVTAAADDADATSAGDPPAATDDQPAPAAGGNEDPNGHGDERGVGRGGTPPGHGGPSPDELGPPGPAATQARERARESRS
jgi:hypothetical protein